METFSIKKEGYKSQAWSNLCVSNGKGFEGARVYSASRSKKVYVYENR
jgi:hypothetical protein